VKKFVAIAVLSCVVWGAPAALASGGSSIASAPTVVYGQQEFGNTAADSPFYNFFSNSWWLLPVTTGDRITLDLQSEIVDCTSCISNGPTPDVSEEKIYPIGTSDFNLSSAAPVRDNNPSDTGYLQDVVAASRTGIMPLDFTAYVGNPGPYNFTVYVQHAIVLAQYQSANRQKHRTSFSIAVRNPDGGAITDPSLRMRFVVGNLSRTVAQPFAFSVSWNRRQRGKWQTARITVSGPSYQTASMKIRVKAV